MKVKVESKNINNYILYYILYNIKVTPPLFSLNLFVIKVIKDTIVTKDIIVFKILASPH